MARKKSLVKKFRCGKCGKKTVKRNLLTGVLTCHNPQCLFINDPYAFLPKFGAATYYHDYFNL